MCSDMRVLGIDPGSSITGYGIVDETDNNLFFTRCGAIAAKGLKSFPERLKKIYDGLEEIISECRPDAAVIENIFLSKNVRSAIMMGHARGVAILACVNAGIQVYEYTPMEIKLAVVGYGAAEKRQVKEMVKRLLKLDEMPTESEDASDALAAAICHIHSAKVKGIINANAINKL